MTDLSNGSSAKRKRRSFSFNSRYHRFLQPPCERCSGSNYECFKVLIPSRLEKKFKCVQCRVDRQVCSLSPSGLDHGSSADPVDATPSPSEERVKPKTTKRKASSSPESESRPQPKMKMPSKARSSTSLELKTFVSSNHNASSSLKPNISTASKPKLSTMSKPKPTASSKARPSTSLKGKPSVSSQSFPTPVPISTFSAHLDLEDVRSQVRILSHRLTEVEQARVHERAAYGQSLNELSCRLDHLERFEKEQRVKY